VDTGLYSVPRKLQGHLHREAHDLGRISKIGPEKRAPRSCRNGGRFLKRRILTLAAKATEMPQAPRIWGREIAN
jgi:hypothetical protein